jgi:hypothetical protein
MSQNPSDPVFVSNLPPPTAQSNTLGLAGFITSLVGLVVTGGVLCPVGLILSLIALSKPSRGFAVAGVVLGAIGSCGGCLMISLVTLVGGTAVVAALTIIATGGTHGLQTLDHMMQVDTAITSYESRTGSPPEDLQQLGLPQDILRDGWGNPLEYSLERSPGEWKWTLRSPGPDRVADESDLTFTGEGTAPSKP